jgi:hypothetical protein
VAYHPRSYVHEPWDQARERIPHGYTVLTTHREPHCRLYSYFAALRGKPWSAARTRRSCERMEAAWAANDFPAWLEAAQRIRENSSVSRGAEAYVAPPEVPQQRIKTGTIAKWLMNRGLAVPDRHVNKTDAPPPEDGFRDVVARYYTEEAAIWEAAE